MIARVVRPGSKLPDTVGDLDGEAVVQITSQYEHWFTQRVPELDGRGP